MAFRGFLPRLGASPQSRHMAVWDSHTQKAVSPTSHSPRPMACGTAQGGRQGTSLSLCLHGGPFENQMLPWTQHLLVLTHPEFPPGCAQLSCQTLAPLAQ